MAEKSFYETNHLAKIVLTNFFGAEVKNVETEDGHLEKCVVIPLDRNDLKVDRKGAVCAYAFVNKTVLSSKFNWSHYMQLKASRDFVKKINALGYKTPYLGNIKDATYTVNSKARKPTFIKASDYEQE